MELEGRAPRWHEELSFISFKKANWVLCDEALEGDASACKQGLVVGQQIVLIWDPLQGSRLRRNSVVVARDIPHELVKLGLQL